MGRRTPRWVRWLIASGLVLAGVAAAAVKAAGLDWPWLIVAATIVGAVVVPWSRVLMAGLEYAEKLKNERQTELDRGAARRGQDLVRNFSDPIFLGVHPSFEVADARASQDRPPHVATNRLPVYIKRDLHDSVVENLKPTSFVLILGDSGVGKTRLAFQTTVETLGDHVLFAPEPMVLSETLDQMADTPKAVLWLDDLERFLGTNALTATAVDRLLGTTGQQHTIVATCRLRELDKFSADPTQDSNATENLRRLLALATRITLKREFSPEELDRARSNSTDPRIAEALQHTNEYGLAEYLAAGPQLLSRWQEARNSGIHVRSTALITAAIECRRAGYLEPLPKQLIESISERLLLENKTPVDETIEEAWTWATKPWRGTTALLNETNSGRIKVFEYLVDSQERSIKPGSFLSEEVVRSALAFASAQDARNIGLRAFVDERFQLARTCYMQAMNLLVDNLGRDHVDTLSARNEFAEVLRENGELQEALTEHDVVIEARSRILGPLSRETLMSRLDRVECLLLADQMEEANAECATILESCTNEYGQDDSITLEAREAYADTLLEIGRLDDGLVEFRSIVKRREKLNGPRHPDTVKSRGSLALAMAEVGKLDEAEVEAKWALAATERNLGATHPAAVVERNNYATILSEQGRYREAESYLRGILEVRTQTLGDEHKRTLASQHNLGVVLLSRGDTTQAREVFASVVETKKRVLGKEHASTMKSRLRLATTLDDLDAAIREIEIVVSINRRKRGDKSANTLAARSELADTYYRMGDYEKAETEARSVIEARTQSVGSEHPSTLTTRHLLGKILVRRGQLGRAQAELRLVVNSRKRVLGPDHPDTRESARDLDGT